MNDSYKLLIVDDSKMMRNAIRGIFAADDRIQVAGEAADGEAALEIIPQIDPDVLTMDVNMPVMDGLEATRRIRAEIAPERQPWIIAITANVAAEDKQNCTEAGMNDFLEKPFAKAGFQRVLATVRDTMET